MLPYSCRAAPFLVSLLFLLLKSPSDCWGFVIHKPFSLPSQGVRAPHQWRFGAIPSRRTAISAASAVPGRDAEIWQISDLPKTEGDLLRDGVMAADKHKVADVVCLIRSAGWNIPMEKREQERLLLKVKRGPLLSAHGRSVPREFCMEPTYMNDPKGASRGTPGVSCGVGVQRKKEDLLQYEWEMMVIATGLSPTHLDSVAETVIQELTRIHGPSVYLGRDGRGTSGWVALNFGKLHFHLLTPITRERYALEILHKDAPRINLKEILTANDDIFGGFEGS